MAEDFFHDFPLVNDRNHPHGVLTLGADQRVGVPDLQEDVAPFFGGEFGGRRRGAGRAQGCGGLAAVLGAKALAAHFVGIPAVVTDHLRAFVRDVLGDGGERRSGASVP